MDRVNSALAIRPPLGRRVLDVAAGAAVVWTVVGATGVWVTHRVVAAAPVAAHPSPVQARLRLAMLAFELASAAVWVGLGALIVGLGGELAGRSPFGRWASRFRSGWLTAAIGVPLLIYGVSWAAFWTAGSFIDHEAVQFWMHLPQPGTVLEWTSPALSWGVPAAAVAVAATLGFGLPRVLRRASTAVVGGLAGTAGAAAVGLAAFGLWGGSPSPSGAPGQRELLGAVALSPRRLWEVRRYQCGPCSAALLDLTDLASPDPSVPQPSPSVAVVYRPLLSMPDYVRRVDPGRVKQWDVVVITVESMRADALRRLGGTRDVMPNADALAAESVAFADAHTQATHTNYAVGCPLSGEYPLRSTREYAFPARIRYPHVMLYDVLKAVGYRVGIFSSDNQLWHGQANFLRTPSVDAYHDAQSWQDHRGQTYVSPGDEAFARWAQETQRAGAVDDRYTVALASDWIDRQPGPYFAYLNFQSSHFPYFVPADFPRRFSPDHAGFAMSFERYPPGEAGAVRGMYDDSLRYVDAQIGRLVDHLKATGRWDRTVLVLTGDHGQAFYEHGLPTHANAVYAEVVHVPLLVHAPGLAAAVDGYPSEHVDVPPSVLHLLGLPPHPEYQGLDLFDPRRPPHRSIYTMVQTPLADQVAIVQDRLKLVHDLRGDTFALFDESADPGDVVNRINDPAQRERVSHLDERLSTWRAVQLSYYNNALYQGACYPPVLPDE